jgi:hypothetical protein
MPESQSLICFYHHHEPENKVHLICKETGTITVKHRSRTSTQAEDGALEFLGRYTSPGIKLNRDGIPAYPINELGGRLKLAERFHVVGQRQDLPSSYTEAELLDFERRQR